MLLDPLAFLEVSVIHFALKKTLKIGGEKNDTTVEPSLCLLSQAEICLF